VKKFQEFRRELVRRGTEISPAAGREWGDNDANRTVRTALTNDLDSSGSFTRTDRATSTAKSSTVFMSAALEMMGLGIASLLLAMFGALVIQRSIARPLARRHPRHRGGRGRRRHACRTVRDRPDEIGALARSIAVFQDAMRRNVELNITVLAEAEAKVQRQEQIAAETARFGTDIEASLSKLDRLFQQMLSASSLLADAADLASDKTGSAATASGEASANVRDIAAAAEELAVAVSEINRQVVQSNAIATKAVGEAALTSDSVKELSEGGPPHRRRDQAHHCYRRADQPARAQRHHRGGARRRGRTRFCGGGRRGQGAVVTDGEGDREIGAQITAMQSATGRSIQA